MTPMPFGIDLTRRFSPSPVFYAGVTDLPCTQPTKVEISLMGGGSSLTEASATWDGSAWVVDGTKRLRVESFGPGELDLRLEWDGPTELVDEVEIRVHCGGTVTTVRTKERVIFYKDAQGQVKSRYFDPDGVEHQPRRIRGNAGEPDEGGNAGQWQARAWVAESALAWVAGPQDADRAPPKALRKR